MKFPSFSIFQPILMKFCLGEFFYQKNKVGKVWSRYNHFLTYQPDLPKLSYSEMAGKFHDGITLERFELLSQFFVWWLITTSYYGNEHLSKFHPCIQLAISRFWEKISRWANFAIFYPIWFKLGTEVICNPPIGKWTFEVAATIFGPTGPTYQYWLKFSNFYNF